MTPEDIDDVICRHCLACVYDKHLQTGNPDDYRCDILATAIKKKVKPPEWTIDVDFDDCEVTTDCTHFREWNWGDADALNEPYDFDRPYICRDPNQLSLFPDYAPVQQIPA